MMLLLLKIQFKERRRLLLQMKLAEHSVRSSFLRTAWLLRSLKVRLMNYNRNNFKAIASCTLHFWHLNATLCTCGGFPWIQIAVHPRQHHCLVTILSVIPVLWFVLICACCFHLVLYWLKQAVKGNDFMLRKDCSAFDIKYCCF